MTKKMHNPFNLLSNILWGFNQNQLFSTLETTQLESKNCTMILLASLICSH